MGQNLKPAKAHKSPLRNCLWSLVVKWDTGFDGVWETMHVIYRWGAVGGLLIPSGILATLDGLSGGPCFPPGWCSAACCLTLLGTFHLLFWSLLTLFLEGRVLLFPISHPPTPSACSRGIWCQELYLKGSILRSMSVSHSSALARGTLGGQGGSRAMPWGMGVSSGQAPGDRGG